MGELPAAVTSTLTAAAWARAQCSGGDGRALSLGARALLLTVATIEDEGGPALTMAALGAVLDVGERRVQQLAAELEAVGLMLRSGRGGRGRPSTYILLRSDLSPADGGKEEGNPEKGEKGETADHPLAAADLEQKGEKGENPEKGERAKGRNAIAPFTAAAVAENPEKGEKGEMRLHRFTVSAEVGAETAPPQTPPYDVLDPGPGINTPVTLLPEGNPEDDAGGMQGGATEKGRNGEKGETPKPRQRRQRSGGGGGAAKAKDPPPGSPERAEAISAVLGDLDLMAEMIRHFPRLDFKIESDNWRERAMEIEPAYQHYRNGWRNWLQIAEQRRQRAEDTAKRRKRAEERQPGEQYELHRMAERLPDPPPLPPDPEPRPEPQAWEPPEYVEEDLERRAAEDWEAWKESRGLRTKQRAG
jgi:hypothetical protein